jgi:hypothetical protein
LSERNTAKALMRRAYLISLLLILVLTGLLSRRTADTAPEFLPLASAIGFVEGYGRAIEPETLAAGVRPSHSVRIGTSIVPRTPPAMFLHIALVTRIYRTVTGHPIDDSGLPELIWLINFSVTSLWTLILFGAIHRLALFWKPDSVSDFFAVEVSWAAIAGSLALGWFGVESVYLAMAALCVWNFVLILESFEKPSTGKLLLAGLCGGFAGAAHPAGWVFPIVGLLAMFIGGESEEDNSKGPGSGLAAYISMLVLGMLIALAGNFQFFGTFAPVQAIDRAPLNFEGGFLPGAIYQDILGFNGIIWLCPLILPGIVALAKGAAPKHNISSIRLALMLALVATLSWGIAEDMIVQTENEMVPGDFRVLFVEINNGHFSLVDIGGQVTTPEEVQAYYERLHARTDIFVYQLGRASGIPIMLPILLILGIYGVSCFRENKFWNSWIWVGVRIGALLGLVMSQAPYGSVTGLVQYTGQAIVDSSIPILESLLALCIRVAELLQSGVVSF